MLLENLKGASIKTLARTPTGEPVVAQPRARGAVRLSVKVTATGTGIRNLRQAGSSKIVFPRANAPGLEAVFVNTAGGVTGGDVFSTDICAESQTELTTTTQAAERAYRAQPYEIGSVSNRVKLCEGAHLNWLPQETILFNNCAFERSLCVDMDTSATMLLVEPLIFGRGAMGETLTQCHFKDRIEIRRDGIPLFLDAMTFAGDVAAHLSRANVAQGAGAMASVIFIAPNAASFMTRIRALLSDSSGASMIRDQLLYIRILAADGFALRKSLIPILNYLSNNSLPRSWML